MLDFDALSKIVTSISAPITLCVALYGLKSWKNELRGKSQYGLAGSYKLFKVSVFSYICRFHANRRSSKKYDAYTS
jgi:formate hydrogenlyase subunit 3/multisubunit Na+/H+ antiporter MnhD subunit